MGFVAVGEGNRVLRSVLRVFLMPSTVTLLAENGIPNDLRSSVIRGSTAPFS